MGYASNGEKNSGKKNSPYLLKFGQEIPITYLKYVTCLLLQLVPDLNVVLGHFLNRVMSAELT